MRESRRMCVGAKRFALFGTTEPVSRAIRGLSRSNPSVGRSPHRQTFRSYFPLRGNPPMERKGYLALIKAWCKTSVDRTVLNPLSAPTRGWLGTQGRSKNSVAPFNPLCGRGMGLVETLVAAGVGAVMLYGVLRVAAVSVQTSQVAVTTQVEVELSVILQQISESANKNSGEMCKKNLKPSRLTNGSLPSAGWLGRLDSSNNLDPNSAILKPGPFRDGLLDIKSLEFRNAGTDDWRFFVFYTKPQLGNYETIGDRVCSTTDKSGCYFKTCKLDIETIQDPNSSKTIINKCEFKTCQKFTISADCSSGTKYLKAIKKDGSRICGDIQDFCSAGEVLSFITKSDGTREKQCMPVILHNPDYDPDNPNAAPKFRDFDCPEGEVLLGFNANDGSHNCAIACTGGRVHKDGDCACPSSRPTWDGVNCS